MERKLDKQDTLPDGYRRVTIKGVELTQKFVSPPAPKLEPPVPGEPPMNAIEQKASTIRVRYQLEKYRKAMDDAARILPILETRYVIGPSGFGMYKGNSGKYLQLTLIAKVLFEYQNDKVPRGTWYGRVKYACKTTKTPLWYTTPQRVPQRGMHTGEGQGKGTQGGYGRAAGTRTNKQAHVGQAGFASIRLEDVPTILVIVLTK